MTSASGAPLGCWYGARRSRLMLLGSWRFSCAIISNEHVGHRMHRNTSITKLYFHPKRITGTVQTASYIITFLVNLFLAQSAMYWLLQQSARGYLAILSTCWLLLSAPRKKPGLSRNPRSSAPSPEFLNLFLIWKWRVLMHYWCYFMRFRATRE